MTPEQRKRIINRHSDSVLRYGHSPAALYWSSKEIQELRFQVLTEIGIESGDSLLDVCCGFGDLSAYLQKQGLDIDYSGLDISPDLIKKGKQAYPQATFFCGDLFDFAAKDQAYDYIMLSGGLAEPMKDNGDYAYKSIEQMYKSCRKGLAFNILNAEDEWVASRFDLQSFLPQTMLAFCENLGATCRLRSDYLDNDFTVFMEK